MNLGIRSAEWKARECGKVTNLMDGQPCCFVSIEENRREGHL